MNAQPVTTPAMRHKRGRSAYYKYLVFIPLIALTALYQLRSAAHQQLGLDEGGHVGPLTPGAAARAAGAQGLPGWGSRWGTGQGQQQLQRGLQQQPQQVAHAQQQQLAVLLPCWKDCAQAAVLILYLSSLLRQQGIPFRIHVLEQSGSAPFNPGLLVDVGYQLVKQASGGFAANYIAYQQPGLMPHVSTSYAYPSAPFLHLAAEQSLFNYALPYELYCGGAWLARLELFEEAGGMSAAYVGFQGLEDDFCRRVLARLGGGEIPRAQPGSGKFTVSDDDALQELQAMHRRRNQQTFESRWGQGTATAAAESMASKDGLASVPPDLQQLLMLIEQTESHSWWRVQLPS